MQSKKIGVVLPGVNNKIKDYMSASTNLPAWVNFNFLEFLKEHVDIDKLEFRFTNDVNALAWGHYLFQQDCHLARMLQTAILFLDPRVIVLCGPVMLHNPWLLDFVIKRVDNYLLPNVQRNAKIMPSSIPDTIDLLGAAHL